MSLELYSLIPGQQVKRDRDLSNVTIQCDPRAVYPDNQSAANNRHRKREAGKIAVEDDICNLNLANLTVNGKLTLNSEIAAEICNIFCPVDFNLVAGNNINETAAANMNLTATAGTITGTAGGAISLTSSDSTNIQSTGLLAADGSINLTSSANTTGTGGQIVLTAGSTANDQNNSGVEVNGNNAAPTTNPSTESGASLNVFPQVASAKGLSVVTLHDTASEHAIAADLTGTTILRADGDAGTNIGATGHLLFSPADNEDPSIAVTVDPGTSTAEFVGLYAADSCGQIRITNTGGAGTLTARVTFQKNYPTNILNVFLTPASRDAASVMGLPGTLHISDTNFDYFEVTYTSVGGGDIVDLNYFVVDAVPPAWQLG